MRTIEEVVVDEAVKLFLSQAGRIGGQSRSPLKISAVTKNLIKARQLRWSKKTGSVVVVKAPSRRTRRSIRNAENRHRTKT